MKPIHIRRTITASPVLGEKTAIWRQWRRQKLPLYLFLAMCFNLVVAPVVYATAAEKLSRSQSWGLGLLGLVILGLCIYLFFVMFIPEKF